MSVQIDPSAVLGFPRPLTQHVKRALHITNKNAQPVAFKVKTTAPKLYCVRPNSGRVEPGETVEVQVMLQAMKEEPPLNAKCKDKFLIQSTSITPEKEQLAVGDIWNSELSDEIHSQKIRVVYLPPEGQTVPEEDEVAHQANVSSFIGNTSDSQQFHTVQAPNGSQAQPIPDFFASSEETAPILSREAEPDVHEQPSIIHAQPAPIPVPPPTQDLLEEEEEEEQQQPQQQQTQPAVVNVNVHTPQPPTPPPPAPAPAPIVTERVIDPNPELLSKLEAAKSEIERLRNLISSMPDPSTVPTNTIDDTGSTVTPTELRRRSTRGGTTTVFSDDDGSTWDGQTEIGSYVDDGVLHGQQEGVPLQVVIVVALSVFVTTYLFF
ncbi:hypothetical protein QCA50_015274 [Cerrena zonata]|uniref:MSP domain-containing protein n=1 Tax=Cerrena zonata TaxID=2478898 RepID=A0AAW0FQI3_9APHY